MLRSLLVFWLLILAPLQLLAEPAFFSVTRGEQQLWLLGSVHAGTKQLYPLPSSVTKAWQQSSQLVVEADLSTLSATDRQNIAQLTQLPPNQTLEGKLPTDLYRQSMLAARELGLDLNTLNRLQPWYLSIVITQQMLNLGGFQSELGIDSYLTQAAITTQKPIAALESVTEQLSYLALVAEHQELMLENTLAELPKMNQTFSQILQLWKAGDQQQLHALLMQDLGPQELQSWLQDKLLNERNQNWMQRIPKLKDGSFVVVGALHLYGKEGLIERLKAQGYKVELLTKFDAPAINPKELI